MAYTADVEDRKGDIGTGGGVTLCGGEKRGEGMQLIAVDERYI
jgi:hypothetical protein